MPDAHDDARAMIALAVGAVCALAGQGPADVDAGRALVARYECERCHDLPSSSSADPALPSLGLGLPRAAGDRDRSCVKCHQAILAGDVLAPPPMIAGWRAHIVHLREVPTLATAPGRLRASWLAQFLLAPRDLRRGLAESMPRLALSAADARAIAAFVTQGTEPPSSTPLPPGDVARGLGLLEAKGCGTCHAFTGAREALVARALPVAVDGAALVRGMSLAPDLRFTRDRTTRAWAAAWLAADPAQPSPLRVMPFIPLAERERADLVAAIFDAPLREPPRRIPPALLPPLARPVRFAEVQDAILQKTCIHCHADDSQSLGIGGPGNNGGFGYAGTGLVLTSYERVQAGSVERTVDPPRHRSVFRAVEQGPLKGMPLLVAQLRARQLEEVGIVVEGVTGMPLGLPALGPGELQLVSTWVAQGRPL